MNTNIQFRKLFPTSLLFFFIFFYLAQQPPLCQALLIREVSRSHSTTHYSTWCVQVLRSPKEAFAAAMQSWRERCEKRVCLQGDYVEK